MNAAALPRPRPPAEIGWLVQVVGEEAALLLVEARGGSRLYVPRQADAASPLTAIIGLDAARRLGQGYGGETVKLPLVRRWRVKLYRSQGCSYGEIARRVGMTERGVHLCLQEASLTSAQRPLPGLE